jgi:hypothetical protein
MPIGDFYQRGCESGADYEVVLQRPEEEDLCKRELRRRHVQVRDVATIGHFTIHLDDPLEWAEVGAVVFGEVIADRGVRLGRG